jgi:hypothetical protein
MPVLVPYLHAIDFVGVRMLLVVRDVTMISRHEALNPGQSIRAYKSIPDSDAKSERRPNLEIGMAEKSESHRQRRWLSNRLHVL